MNKDLTYLKQLTTELGKEVNRISTELGEEIKRLEEKPKPWPQEGGDVFVLWSEGDIVKHKYSANSTLKDILQQGNVFRTRAEAEAEWHYRDVAYKLSQQEGARKFVEHKINFGLGFDAEVKKLYLSSSKMFTGSYFNVYFDTEKQVVDAISAVGEQEIIRAIRRKELGETS